MTLGVGVSEARAQYGSYRNGAAPAGWGTASGGADAYGSYREWRPAGSVAPAESVAGIGPAVVQEPGTETADAALRTMKAAVRETRHAAGFVAGVVTTVHPVIRVAGYVGLIDRRAIVRRIRGD